LKPFEATKKGWKLGSSKVCQPEKLLKYKITKLYIIFRTDSTENNSFLQSVKEQTTKSWAKP